MPLVDAEPSELGDAAPPAAYISPVLLHTMGIGPASIHVANAATPMERTNHASTKRVVRRTFLKTVIAANFRGVMLKTVGVNQDIS